MKKTIISMLLLAIPVALLAQLKVNSGGQVLIGNNSDSLSANLTVGNVSLFNGSKSAINAGISNSSSGINLGISGVATPVSSYGYNVGVFGKAGYSGVGGNYGVYGTLSSGADGVCIFGGIGCLFAPVFGKYAGLFDGQVLATGEIRANSFVSSSDARLKTNIESFALEGKALEKVLEMDVVSYNYKERKLEKDEHSATDDAAWREFNKKQAEIRHYGLLAQELQKIYPNLVYEGQNGYLGINYVELVPVLIRSIQELKQELDEVRGGNDDFKMSRGTVTAVASDYATGNILYQNTPNPFKEQTVIRFSLADNAQNAAICIFDMTGKMLKKLPISLGETSVSINGWELGEGMFLYTLLVNGHEVDTKRMILSK